MDPPYDSRQYWPGELPLPECFALLCPVVAALLLVVAGVFHLRSLRCPRFGAERGRWQRRSRNTAQWALVCSSGLVPCAVGLLWRNYQLAPLKRFLQERTVALRAFEAAHPQLDQEATVLAFRRTDPGPWTFRFDELHTPVKVYPTIAGLERGVYFAVNFGGLGADIAVFDPDTLWVIHSY